MENLRSSLAKPRSLLPLPAHQRVLVDHVIPADERCGGAGSARSIKTTKDQGDRRNAALAGADVATIPPGVIKGLAKHVLTAKGLDQFNADRKVTGQAVL